jgi:hypothetical protein
VCLQEPGVKKKVGRPIAYTGDPNDPNLKEEDRRRVRRRIANRESARRVRLRRLRELEEANNKVLCIPSSLCLRMWHSPSSPYLREQRLVSCLHPWHMPEVQCLLELSD